MLKDWSPLGQNSSLIKEVVLFCKDIKLKGTLRFEGESEYLFERQREWRDIKDIQESNWNRILKLLGDLSTRVMSILPWVSFVVRPLTILEVMEAFC